MLQQNATLSTPAGEAFDVCQLPVKVIWTPQTCFHATVESIMSH